MSTSSWEGWDKADELAWLDIPMRITPNLAARRSMAARPVFSTHQRPLLFALIILISALWLGDLFLRLLGPLGLFPPVPCCARSPISVSLRRGTGAHLHPLTLAGARVDVHVAEAAADA